MHISPDIHFKSGLLYKFHSQNFWTTELQIGLSPTLWIYWSRDILARDLWTCVLLYISSAEHLSSILCSQPCSRRNASTHTYVCRRAAERMLHRTMSRGTIRAPSRVLSTVLSRALSRVPTRVRSLITYKLTCMKIGKLPLFQSMNKRSGRPDLYLASGLPHLSVKCLQAQSSRLLLSSPMA